MKIQRKVFTAPSCDGIHTLSGVVIRPEGDFRGFFHIVHGMTEHMGRYERLMSDLAMEGWLCFGYDHLGHGKTAKNDSELGYIAPEKGWELLARDVKVFSDAVMTAYGTGEKKPYCLLGHSMGSFVVRLAAEKYVTPDRLMIMGTGGSNGAAGIGLALIRMIRAFRGDHHISPLVESLAFGSYNKHFGGGTEADPKPWLTADEEARKRYYADPYCMFHFTVSAMGDLITLTKLANRRDWYENIAKDLPILLVSGENDPVGNYGKGVREVEKELRSAGACVQCVLYSEARHEILNDKTYEAVKDALSVFCKE